MVAAAWDSLLDRVRQWMIVRFALNTDAELWVWGFVIGAAAHRRAENVPGTIDCL
jgi:hypothetical protein